VHWCLKGPALVDEKEKGDFTKRDSELRGERRLGGGEKTRGPPWGGGIYIILKGNFLKGGNNGTGENGESGTFWAESAKRIKGTTSLPGKGRSEGEGPKKKPTSSREGGLLPVFRNKCRAVKGGRVGDKRIQGVEKES